MPPASAATVGGSSSSQSPTGASAAAAAAAAAGPGSFASVPDARHDVSLCFDAVTITRGKRTLLDQCSGLVRGGCLTVIISSCGGRGDYHLLSVLAAQRDINSGLVLAKGTLARTPAYRQHCALIDDEMSVIDQLTVRQNLLYGSEMRTRASAADHAARLRLVVQWMDLGDHLSRQVQGCSQDVRRRVSIARELMLHPAAVFIDSAIEDLATHEARKLLGLLRVVAMQTGAVIVASMLQPRWALLELVDEVIVMEGPAITFAGRPRDLVREASVLSCRPPPDTNSLASPNNNSNNSINAVCDAPETTLNALYRVASSPHLSLFTSIPNLQQLAVARQQQVGDVVVRFSEGQLPLLEAPFERRQPLMVWKFCLLVKYGLLQVFNRLLTHLVSAALVLLAAVLVGVVYQNQGQAGQAGMQNRVGIIFFLVSSTFLHNLLFVEATKRAYVSFQRHRAHGYYDCVTFLLYWLFVNGIQRFIGTVVFMAVVYGLAQVHHGTLDLTSLQTLVGIMALVSFASAVLVWLVCCVVPKARYAQFLLFGIYAYNTVLAGIVLNVKTLPPFFQTASFASFIRLGYESAISSEFADRTFGCSATPGGPPDGGGDNSTSGVFDGAAATEVWTSYDDGVSNTSFVVTSTASPVASESCFTGADYMRFLDFEEYREQSNLALLAYYTAGMAALALFAMWVGKAR